MAGVHLIVDGQDGPERLGPIDEGTGEFPNSGPVWYDEATGHWVVTTATPPPATIGDIEFPFHELEHPQPVRIPREKVYRARSVQPIDPSAVPPDDDIVTDRRIVLVSEFPVDSADVYDSKNYRFLSEPEYDTPTDHWKLTYHNPTGIMEGGRTNIVHSYIPRERVFFVA